MSTYTVIPPRDPHELYFAECIERDSCTSVTAARFGTHCSPDVCLTRTGGDVVTVTLHLRAAEARALAAQLNAAADAIDVALVPQRPDERDAGILAARNRSESIEQIARAFHMTERGVRKALIRLQGLTRDPACGAPDGGSDAR